MSDTIWQALADAYIRGAQDVHDDHAKLIDWKAEAAPIEAEHRNQVIRELIEKADADAKDCANRLDIKRKDTRGALIEQWLKSQMESSDE